MRTSNLRDVRHFEIKDFKGLDLSTNPLNVAKNRAIDGKNFYLKDDIEQMRPGWKQVAEFGTSKINGMYEYESGKYIVYAGTTFYKLEFTATHYTRTSITTPTGAMVSDKRCQFFKHGDYIFIIGCGDYLVWYDNSGTWTLALVKDWSETYIPTTTISIDWEGYTGTARLATLERPNLLTMKRKNTMRGVEGSSSGTPPATTTFILDSEVYIGTNSLESIAEITVERLDASGAYETYKLYCYYNGTAGEAEIRTNLSVVVGTLYQDDGVTAHTPGKIVLTSHNTEPPLVDDNITIEFTAIDSTLNSEAIRTQLFGVIFGVDGQSNQLFVAGTGTRDYFSYPNDFTYFPDNNYKVVGISSDLIIGYMKLSDKALCIFKEKSDSQVSAYIRTGTLVSDYDAITIETQFTDVLGGLGEQLASTWATGNLNGDSMYLANNGVKSIVLQENIASDQRITIDRSSLIDKYLKTLDMSDAVMFSHDDYLYISIGSECFVCHTKNKFTNPSGYLEYEWWRFDNVAARIFFSDGDDLYFGTTDGRLCKFDYDIHTDRTFEVVSAGDMVFQPYYDRAVYNASLDITDDLKVKFEDTTLYELMFSFDDVDSISGNTISLDSAGDLLDNIYLLNDGDSFTLVGDDETDPVTVYIDNVDLGNLTFDLVDASGVAIDVASYVTTQMFILNAIAGTDLYIKELDTVNHYFQLAKYEDGDPISLIFYEGTTITDSGSTSVAIVLITTTAVTALWVTPYLDLGTYLYLKTVKNMALVYTGSLSYGYEVKNDTNEAGLLRNDGFSFDDLDFSNLSFSSFVTTYSLKVKLRNINYIKIYVESASSRGCSIEKLAIKYQYMNEIRGDQ